MRTRDAVRNIRRLQRDIPGEHWNAERLDGWNSAVDMAVQLLTATAAQHGRTRRVMSDSLRRHNLRADVTVKYTRVQQ